MSIRVVVVDDQALVRRGFAMILKIHDDIEVVAEAGTGLEAIAVARVHRPDVILMDIRMPEMDGLEATSQILAEADWDVRVLILTTFDPDEYVYQALRAGASAFVLKDIPADQLATAVRTVADGGALLAPSITRRLIGRFTERLTVDAAVSRRLERLTDREREVLIAIARGSATPRSPRNSSSGLRPSSRTCRASSRSSVCATEPKPSSSPTKAGSSRPATTTSDIDGLVRA
jgi:DNA-binding NarL/FixJ family response regulator